MSKLRLFTFLLISYFGIVNGFTQSDIEENEIDSNYIVSYSDIFTPRFVLLTKRNEFDVENVNLDSTSQNSTTLTFKPNDPVSIGLGFSYKWLGMNLAFNLPSANNKNEIYGKTKRFDFGTHIYGRKIIMDFTFQWYKGYYLANPQGIVPGWNEGDPYPSRGDIKVSTYGLAAFYIFNKNRIIGELAHFQNRNRRIYF